MNNIDANRTRSQAVQLQTRQAVAAGDRFQSLMQAPLDEYCENGSATDDGEQGRSSTFAGDLFSKSSEENSPALPKAVINLFWESLQQEFAQTRDVAGFLNELLRDITSDLQNGRRLQDDSWKLVVRLRPDFLPATVLEISCNDNRISIVLRTAQEETYRIISDALPRLNAALAEKSFCTDKAQLYLVALEDLP